MKFTICIAVFLFMHTVSFSQMRLIPANDTVTFHSVSGRILNALNTLPGTFQNIQAIPANFYAAHLGFFCKQELKMQQIPVPVTFRVGTMDQCNYLEQKPGYKID